MPRLCAAASASATLQTDQERRFQFEWTSGDELAHVLAFDVLHRDEVHAVHFVEIEDGADVWMVQRRGETRFAFEAFQVCFFRAEFRGYDFDHNRRPSLRSVAL